LECSDPDEASTKDNAETFGTRCESRNGWETFPSKAVRRNQTPRNSNASELLPISERIFEDAGYALS
jgi:hypothetical protein